jgi:photosystem II stability/assembly factor-like uncharacterized protein
MKPPRRPALPRLLLLSGAVLLGLLPGCATPRYGARLVPTTQATTAHLRGVAAVSDRIAWASGSEGTIVRTTDGGATWQQIPAPAEAAGRDLRDIHAESEDTALVMAIAAPARIWRTEDGGATWDLVLDDPREGTFLDSFDIDDNGFGVAWGDPVDDQFLCHRTLDGGRSWEPLLGLPSPLIGEAGFAASGTCVLCDDDRVWIATGGGAAARVLRGIHRGEEWLRTDTTLRAGDSSAGAFSITLLEEPGRAVVVGGDHEQPRERDGTASWTANSGINWLETMVAPGGFRSCVDVGRGDLLVACGPTGVDSSDNGGQTWLPVASRGYHAIAFAPDRRTAFLVGPEGRTARLRLERR